MLKVVGASWLQTRISTYILVAVGLLGIGAIVLGEFGGIEKDGTYAATVFWNHKGGYRIDFWGQGNDLSSLPKGAARAYYKTRIEETGWSTVEIETTPAYPDAVQAYAAGLLEGSLTWQLIHHHWYNTIGTVCSSTENEERCEAIRQSLRENTAVIRERADLLATEDPFWHMVRLFYAQLEGMEAGWRFAVRRSRRSVEIDTEDFLWLAMSSELRDFFVDEETLAKASTMSNELPEASTSAGVNDGVILVKSLDRSAEGLDPILAIAQNTVAPYSKMLRLLKRYTFGYHVSGNRHADPVAARTIFMSSYPGAVSSHDEYYVARGGIEDQDLVILAGMPLRDSREPNLDSNSNPTGDSNDQEEQREKEKELDSAFQAVLSAPRIMAASRLSLDPKDWSRLLSRGNSGKVKTRQSSKSVGLQWLSVRPKDWSVWLIEQDGSTVRSGDYSVKFRKSGFVYCDGRRVLEEKNSTKDSEGRFTESPSSANLARFFSDNITSVEAMRKLMRGASEYVDSEENEEAESDSSSSTTAKTSGNVESRVSHALDPLGKFVYRGDLENAPKAFGVIDTKISIATADGLESFEATSGPPFGHELTSGNNNLTPSFDWNKNFGNVSHIGQPQKFEFQSVVPQWVWQ